MNSKIRRSLAVAIFAALTLIPLVSSGSARADGIHTSPMAGTALIHG